MTVQQTMSFADAAILDAVGRKVRVDLVLKPVTASSPSRLISRFLGFLGDDRLVIEAPRTEKKEKVFLPVGWLLGMSFEADNMWLQTRTTVVDHCLFLVQPARRADALVVQKPLSILTCNRRSNPRHRVSASSRTVATFWPWTDGQTQTAAQVAHAQIVDYSVGGLGIKADTPLPMKIGEKVVIQLRTAHQPDCLILQGQLRHCTLCEDGAWRAGFGDVAEVEPGQPQGLIEFLASSKQADDQDEA